MKTESPRILLFPELFFRSRAKTSSAKRNEKGYGDENRRDQGFLVSSLQRKDADPASSVKRSKEFFVRVPAVKKTQSTN